jgi:hypothetical protein
MVRECFNCETGIIFDMDMLDVDLGIDIDLERETYVSVVCKTNAT